jgi:crotonobetainyl-CoA:carnitine CoA-transferase CaiB-like acyl-CoA transferase
MTADLIEENVGPLDGVTVIEFASNVAGPFAGLLLRDLGAKVLKIEHPDRGDDVRGWPPFGAQHSAAFSAFNRGKQSIGLDISCEAGAEVVRKLVATADILLEGMRPGKMEARGLGSDPLCELNPKLVYCSISGFGRRGPRAGEAGFDAIVQAYSGLMDLTGHISGPPARMGTAVIDLGTGLWAALGVVAALTRRDVTGNGGRVEATLLGTASGLMMHHIASVTMAGLVPARAGTAQHNTAPYEAIFAKDAPVMIGVTNQSLWERVGTALNCAELVTDPRFRTNADRVKNRTELVRLLSKYVENLTAADVAERLRSAGVPSSEIRNIADLPSDEQILAMELIQRISTGEQLAVSPVIFEGRPASLLHMTVPALGSSTEEVLREIGYDDEALAGLREEGAIR